MLRIVTYEVYDVSDLPVGRVTKEHDLETGQENGLWMFVHSQSAETGFDTPEEAAEALRIFHRAFLISQRRLTTIAGN